MTKAGLDAAHRMLETSEQPVQRIALLCGFADTDAMRHIFNKLLNMPPGQYRQVYAETLSYAI